MTTIREIAKKYDAQLAALFNGNLEHGRSTKVIIEAALREFGEELAKMCEAQKIEPGIPGYAAYNAAFTKCATEIRAAKRESL